MAGRYDKCLLLALVAVLHCLVIPPVHCTQHRTAAASERPNDLRCYVCESMDPLYGHSCVHAPTTLKFEKRCRDDARICMTKRFSYTTSTENATSEPRLFSMERNCTAKCEPGCIIIGERTKLYACTECCESNLCNTGNGGAGTDGGRGWGAVMPYAVPLLLPLLLH
ncbi:hypothetical protein ONE63_002295 [Megalurothrips usitatus]|uniref:Uncharacterized protein n=1 Tax=Megalurothrips usitatus TaxID=439358 RepID=A0AAV7X7P9_9NEOP|nr:hypothetical protein ONE63_002295 [Megalurothrips usitatus]